MFEKSAYYNQNFITFEMTGKSFHTKTTTQFDKQARKLHKKYLSVMSEINALRRSLAESPFQGDGLGNDLYKVRMAIKSKGRGKSGGARVITLVKVIDETITLVAIYDKSEMATISDKELRDLLK